MKYTRFVRRLLAILTLVSLCSLQSQALAFHVHAASEHAGDDHHHGPAIHHHEEFDGELHVDGDDDGVYGRVITLTVPPAAGSAPISLECEPSDSLPVPELRLVSEVRAVDVRSHSPPQTRDSLLRGPPTSAVL